MLVLTRTRGESIMIGDRVRIVVTDISSGRVRIGFEAPDDVMIYRGELFESMQKQAIETCVGEECYVNARTRPNTVSATILDAYLDRDRAYVDVELLNGVKHRRVPLSDVHLIPNRASTIDS